jgi:hypothetical protein
MAVDKKAGITYHGIRVSMDHHAFMVIREKSKYYGYPSIPRTP